MASTQSFLPDSQISGSSPLSWLLISESQRIDGHKLEPSSFLSNGSFVMDSRVCDPEQCLHPVFRDFTIAAPVVFTEGTRHFAFGASFVNVIFKQKVDFTFVQFYGPAYFWGCTFEEEFDLSNATIRPNAKDVHRREPGEANFSFCHFNKAASYNRTTFKGPGYLHRTIFAAEPVSKRPI